MLLWVYVMDRHPNLIPLIAGFCVGVFISSMLLLDNNSIIDDFLEIMDDSLCTVEFCHRGSTGTISQNGLIITKTNSLPRHLNIHAKLNGRPVKLSWIQMNRIDELFERRAALPTECKPCMDL